MNWFKNDDGKPILLKMVHIIQNNKTYLGDIDGLIGDGDHGMNMNKGFSIFESKIADRNISFSAGLGELGEILLNEIGGSMGPIYGTIFMSMAETANDAEFIDLSLMSLMMDSALHNLYEIIDARIGDKTIVDVFSPAGIALADSLKNDEGFYQALDAMKIAAREGRDSTKDMIAKFGRSSRLGLRSKGVLDAGATSCCLLLEAVADGIQAMLKFL